MTTIDELVLTLIFSGILLHSIWKLYRSIRNPLFTTPVHETISYCVDQLGSFYRGVFGFIAAEITVWAIILLCCKYLFDMSLPYTWLSILIVIDNTLAFYFANINRKQYP